MFAPRLLLAKSNKTVIREAAKTGRLVLVDLAGSENVQRSGADEARWLCFV